LGDFFIGVFQEMAAAFFAPGMIDGGVGFYFGAVNKERVAFNEF